MNEILPFPPWASDMAARVDALFLTILGICTVTALGVIVAMVYFGVKYRRNSQADRGDRLNKRQHFWIEMVWFLGPLPIFLGIFVWASALYVEIYSTPADALEVRAIGKQWMWKFQHPEGQREINTLHLPVDRPVQLTLRSQDVIHSFYVPAFRIKRDVLPGAYNRVSFTPTRVGEYKLLCTEYCGTAHSRMRGRVVVLSQSDYQQWLGMRGANPSPPAAGAALFRAYGCSGCHFGASQIRAPSLVGLYGKPVPLESGETVIADEGYLRDAILLPNKHIVAGYAPRMPSFRGQMDEGEILDIITYIKSLEDGEGAYKGYIQRPGGDRQYRDWDGAARSQLNPERNYPPRPTPGTGPGMDPGVDP